MRLMCPSKLRHRCRLLSLGLVLALSTACSLTSELPDPLEAGWKGKPVCERLNEDADQRVLRCTFAPGVGHERHFHSPHFGYAISGGRMQIKDGDGIRVVEFATGSYSISDGTAWHEVLNVGDTTVVYLLVEPK